MSIRPLPAPTQRRRRGATILAVLGILTVLSGCVVYPAYGPPPPRYYYHGYYWR